MKYLVPAFLLTLGSAPAIAQTQLADTLVVMTVPLKHLSAEVARDLLSPYATTPGYGNSPAGGVFVVPGGNAITIRERVPQYGRMLAVLRQYDRPARKLMFNYQIFIADRSGTHLKDAYTDSLLRRALEYTGFRAIAGGMFRYPSRAEFTAHVDAFKYRLIVGPHEGPAVTDSTPVRADLLIARAPWSPDPTPTPSMAAVLASSNVTMPLGQTLVIGSDTLEGNRAVVVIMRVVLDYQLPGEHRD